MDALTTNAVLTSERDFAVADRFSGLDRRAQNQVVRFVILGSLCFFVGALAKFFLLPVLAILFFLLKYFRRRLDPAEVLLVTLAIAPWLGVHRFFKFGFNFDRGFVLLGLASLWSVHGSTCRRFISNKLDVSICLFLVTCALSAGFCFMHRSPFRILLESMVIPFGYYLIAKNCARKSELLPKLYIGAVIALFTFGSLGLFEAILRTDIISYGEKELDPFRINGPMRMAEDFGLCMNVLLLFYLAMKSLADNFPLPRLFRRALVPLSLLNCYLTLTRGIWLSLGGAWLVQAAKRNWRLVWKVTPPLILALWVFFKFVMPAIAADIVEQRLSNERTIKARIATFKSAVAMFEDHPVLGVGFAAFGEAWERNPDRYQMEYEGESSVSSPHNTFLSLLSETGALGVTTFAFFIVQAFRCAFRLARCGVSTTQREYAVFVIAAMAAYLLAGMGLHFVQSIDFPNKYLFIFLGILSGMTDELVEPESDSVSPASNRDTEGPNAFAG